LVADIHTQRVVIGDFNDLNVLMDMNGQAFLVDADSMQYGPYPCRTFTTRFVDPLCCGSTRLSLARPHTAESDWYAYHVMLLQSLLYVGPYGGVHRPATGKRLQHDERVLQRLTIFGDDIVYPKPALSLATLPDELLDYAQAAFAKDMRGEYPRKLLDNLRWTTCTSCGSVHARATCPSCAAPGAVKETIVIRGTVTATRLFQTAGRILQTVYQGNKLRYIYHESGAFRREDGQPVLAGALDPELRFRIQGDTSLFGKRDKLFVLVPGQAPERLTTDTFRNLSMFDSNAQHRYWIQNGQLVHDNRFGSAYIGDVLPGQTLFWAGKRFGFGFYQVGQLMRAFVFDAEARGLNDQVQIPPVAGQLVDATCVFADTLAWFMTCAQENGRLINRCFVIDNRGKVIAEESAAQEDDSWLAHGIRGHTAQGSFLYAATDEGIVRLEAVNGTVRVDRTFPDTEPFVSTATQLLPAPNGIYAVSSREIVFLQIR
jgi:H/ACA ribonucleoprotein complex subunit 3